MYNTEFLEHLDAITDGNAILYDETFNDAIIGIADIWRDNTKVSVVAYSYDKMIDALVKHQNLSIDDAIEYYDFNISFAYLGPYTPIVITEHPCP